MCIVLVFAKPGNHSTRTWPPQRMLMMIALISQSIPIIWVWRCSFNSFNFLWWKSIISNHSSKYLVCMWWLSDCFFSCFVWFLKRLNMFLKSRLSSLKNTQRTISTILTTRTNKIMSVRIYFLLINKHSHSKYLTESIKYKVQNNIHKEILSTIFWKNYPEICIFYECRYNY